MSVPTTYKITNVQYPDVAVDLILGNPYGTISGYQKHDTPVQKWRKWNVDDADTFFLESDAARGFYASTFLQVDGAPLSGSRNSTIWSRELVDGTNDSYYIKTEDGQYAWTIQGEQDFLTIILKPAAQATGEGSQWTFGSV